MEKEPRFDDNNINCGLFEVTNSAESDNPEIPRQLENSPLKPHQMTFAEHEE